ncbi:MAG: septal ring lytic transglycosylase RlpA family protein [Succinivibrionaceae bacterium]
MANIKQVRFVVVFFTLAEILTGCHSTTVYYEQKPIIEETPSSERIVVRRKRWATGIGSEAKRFARHNVNLVNVEGVEVRYEPYSRIGNADYTVNNVSYEVWNDIEDYQEIGLASWYGPGFHGERTSNGEVYDQKGISAAHKNLPLPSYVKVTNLENNKTLVVRVNDRGPFHEGRIIDLSEGAASRLDIIKNGTAKVKLELIKVPEPANAQYLKDKINSRYIQVVASNDISKANSIAAELRTRLGKNSTEVFVKNYTGLYKVYLGPYRPKIAEKELSRVKSAGYPDSYLLYLD